MSLQAVEREMSWHPDCFLGRKAQLLFLARSLGSEPNQCTAMINSVVFPGPWLSKPSSQALGRRVHLQDEEGKQRRTFVLGGWVDTGAKPERIRTCQPSCRSLSHLAHHTLTAPTLNETDLGRLRAMHCGPDLTINGTLTFITGSYAIASCWLKDEKRYMSAGSTKAQLAPSIFHNAIGAMSSSH